MLYCVSHCVCLPACSGSGGGCGPIAVLQHWSFRPAGEATRCANTTAGCGACWTAALGATRHSSRTGMCCVDAETACGATLGKPAKSSWSSHRRLDSRHLNHNVLIALTSKQRRRMCLACRVGRSVKDRGSLCVTPQTCLSLVMPFLGSQAAEAHGSHLHAVAVAHAAGTAAAVCCQGSSC